MTHSTEQTCSCLLLLWIFCLFLRLAYLPLIMFDTFETETLGFSFWRHQLTLLYYYLFRSVSPIFPINLILALALKSLWLQLIYFCRNTLAGLHWIDIITLYCLGSVPHTKWNIKNLEQVQHRAMRFILGRDYSEHECLSKFSLLPSQYRRDIDDLVFFFQCFKNNYTCMLTI